MSIQNELIAKIKTAYSDFKKKATEVEHDHAIEILKKIHFNSHALINGETQSSIGSEFAHGLAVLDLIPKDSKAIPTSKIEFESKIKPDGEILGVGKWELLDPGWVEALEQWLIHYFEKAPFNIQPPLIQIPDTVNIVIAGDWGTGDWRKNSPSSLVREQMVKQEADYTIHLGDVYYAGTKDQEINNLVETWPVGKKGCFTLNSNHEMYNGAYSYFQQALPNKFITQKGCSYFALENSNWLIIGIDTAYHADRNNLYLVGNLNDGQMSWLKSLPKNKKIIMLSHHEACDITGKNKSKVYEQVVESLSQVPDFWYWGHLHNAIIYQEKNSFHGRCIGHGAIPYGNASMLVGNTDVMWYEDELANDPEIPQRVLNGFAAVSLSGEIINETLIAENGVIRLNKQY